MNLLYCLVFYHWLAAKNPRFLIESWHHTVSDREFRYFILNQTSFLQGDLEDIATLFLDAKASARLLQEQPDKYVSQ